MDPVVIKTNFYDDFSCIADKCSITCCQQWKIEVDDETYKKWNQLTCENGGCCTDFVEQRDGYGVIRLNEHKNCPFLNNEKLCNLVMKHGEEVLHIQRTFDMLLYSASN